MLTVKHVQHKMFVQFNLNYIVWTISSDWKQMLFVKFVGHNLKPFLHHQFGRESPYGKSVPSRGIFYVFLKHKTHILNFVPQ